MSLPTFEAGKWYEVLFNNDETIVGKYMGEKDSYIEKCDVTVHYLLFFLGLEDGDCPMVGHYYREDIEEAKLLPAIRPVKIDGEILYKGA